MIMLSRRLSAKRKGKIIILSGPSGAGKTTLQKKILSDRLLKGILVKSVSVTTRPRRVHEKEGVDYSFVSLKMFLYKAKKGHFLEWEKVFGQYYGTPKKRVEDQLRCGRHVLFSIDVKGAKTLWQKDPSAITIFIKPPSLRILRQRLSLRNTEAPQSLALRLKVAKKELRESVHYQYCIVNDNLTQAYRKLVNIVKSEIK